MADLTVRQAHDAWAAGELTIVDCREAGEHQAQHVPGTILLPMSELLARIDEVPTDGRLAILCRSGNRSGRVADHLTADGDFGDVANIEGGIIAWAAEGLPYEGEVPR
jgi:rhodanese-related sulfurtransferase